MKKTLIIGFGIIMTILVLWLIRIEYIEKHRLYLEIDPAKIVQDETEAGFSNMLLGLSWEEIQEKTDYSFSEQPYSIDDQNDPWKVMTRGVSYVLLYKDRSVVVKYEGFRGHMILKFRDQKLVGIYVIFGTEPDTQEKRMDYDGVKNDPETLFDDLCSEFNRYLAPQGQQPFRTEYAGGPVVGWKNGLLVIYEKDGKENERIVLAIQEMEK